MDLHTWAVNVAQAYKGGVAVTADQQVFLSLAFFPVASQDVHYISLS
jgi:hypothetical protein